MAADLEMFRTREIIINFPWENKKAYAMWLAQTYSMVNHSTRLVALAGAYADLNDNEMHARFIDHSREERGHQLVGISDLEVLGYQLQDFPCLAPSACMYQIQYYWIQHRGPASFFGYTLALERLAADFGREVYERTSQAHGHKACKFLKLHSVADLDHIESAYQVLSKLNLVQTQLAIENLELSAHLYRWMLHEIRSSLGVIPLKMAV